MQVQVRVFPVMLVCARVQNFFLMLMMKKRMVKNLRIQKTSVYYTTRQAVEKELISGAKDKR